MSTSHHGNEDAPKIMKQFLDQVEGRHRAREYPEGRLGGLDDGSLAMAVAHDQAKKTIIIDFGKPVAWIGLGYAEARQFVNLLQQKLTEAAPGSIIDPQP